MIADPPTRRPIGGALVSDDGRDHERHRDDHGAPPRHLGTSTIGYRFGKAYDASLPTLVMVNSSRRPSSSTAPSSRTRGSLRPPTCSRSSRTATAVARLVRPVHPAVREDARRRAGRAPAAAPATARSLRGPAKSPNDPPFQAASFTRSTNSRLAELGPRRWCRADCGVARRMKVKWCCRPPGVLWDRGRWAQVTDEAKRRCPGLWSATRLCPSRALEMRAPVSHSRRARRPPRRSNCDSASSSRFLAA